MHSALTVPFSILALAAAGTSATGVWTTPHDSYSSSVGVLGCKINTDRVAYWPGSVDCNNICVKLSYQGRSTGKSAAADPISGGTVAMEYEEVDASECADLIHTPGSKLPLSASNSINFLVSCLAQPNSWVAKNYVLYNICDPICSVGFDEECTLDLATSNQPTCAHTSEPAADNVKTYTYPGTGDFFTIPAHANYRAAAAAVVHTRSLTFLKPLLGGPYFDLETIWDQHTYYEFADRSVEDTMATMVQEPYVNHVPTMTGGIGRRLLTAFYREHFIFSNSGDAALELVSRTVGIDRIVDEFLFNCTHDRVIDWLLPGVPPTGKSLSIPFTSVNIRGDRLFHEHIAWDQGTVLRQLGLLPEYLPFPYPLPGGQVPGDGKQFEYQVPVAGVETAHKLVDENAVPSNEMLMFATREVDKKSP